MPLFFKKSSETSCEVLEVGYQEVSPETRRSAVRNYKSQMMKITCGYFFHLILEFFARFGFNWLGKTGMRVL